MKFMQKISFTMLLGIFLSCNLLAQLPQTTPTDDEQTVEAQTELQQPELPSIQADDTFEGERPDAGKLITWYNGLLTAFTMLWGFVAKAFRIDKKVNDFVFVVLAGGVTIGGIFVYWGLAGGISAALSVLTAMGIFDLLKGGANQLNAPKEKVKSA